MTDDTQAAPADPEPMSDEEIRKLLDTYETDPYNGAYDGLLDHAPQIAAELLELRSQRAALDVENARLRDVVEAARNLEARMTTHLNASHSDGCAACRLVEALNALDAPTPSEPQGES